MGAPPDACTRSGAASVPGRSRSAGRYLTGRGAMARSVYFYIRQKGEWEVRVRSTTCPPRTFRQPRTNTPEPHARRQTLRQRRSPMITATTASTSSHSIVPPHTRPLLSIACLAAVFSVHSCLSCPVPSIVPASFCTLEYTNMWSSWTLRGVN